MHLFLENIFIIIVSQAKRDIKTGANVEFSGRTYKIPNGLVRENKF